VPFLGRQLLGDSERKARGDDAHLEQRVGVRQHVCEDGVAAFVVGDACLLEIGEDEAVTGLAHEDPVARRRRSRASR